MSADVLVLRSIREREASQEVRVKVQADLQRIRKAAEQIRRMTEIYRERLEGRRTNGR